MTEGAQTGETRKAKLAALLDRQGYVCFWCGYPIITIRDFPFTIVEHGPRQVVYLYLGLAIRAGIASIDHVIPKWMQGPDTPDNLVAACVACNQDRGRMHSPWSLDPTGLDRWLAGKKWPRSYRSPYTHLTFNLDETPSGRDLRMKVRDLG